MHKDMASANAGSYCLAALHNTGAIRTFIQITGEICYLPRFFLIKEPPSLELLDKYMYFFQCNYLSFWVTVLLVTILLNHLLPSIGRSQPH